MLNNVTLISMFGSVAKVVALVSFQRFKVCDSTLVRSNGFKCVLGVVQRVDDNE